MVISKRRQILTFRLNAFLFLGFLCFTGCTCSQASISFVSRYNFVSTPCKGTKKTEFCSKDCRSRLNAAMMRLANTLQKPKKVIIAILPALQAYRNPVTTSKDAAVAIQWHLIYLFNVSGQVWCVEPQRVEAKMQQLPFWDVYLKKLTGLWGEDYVLYTKMRVKAKHFSLNCDIVPSKRGGSRFRIHQSGALSKLPIVSLKIVCTTLKKIFGKAEMPPDISKKYTSMRLTNFLRIADDLEALREISKLTISPHFRFLTSPRKNWKQVFGSEPFKVKSLKDLKRLEDFRYFCDEYFLYACFCKEANRLGYSSSKQSNNHWAMLMQYPKIKGQLASLRQKLKSGKSVHPCPLLTEAFNSLAQILKIAPTGGPSLEITPTLGSVQQAFISVTYVLKSFQDWLPKEAAMTIIHLLKGKTPDQKMFQSMLHSLEKLYNKSHPK